MNANYTITSTISPEFFAGELLANQIPYKYSTTRTSFWINWPEHSKVSMKLDAKRSLVAGPTMLELTVEQKKVWELPHQSITHIETRMERETLYAILAGILSSLGTVSLLRQEVNPYISLLLILLGIFCLYVFNNYSKVLVIGLRKSEIKLKVEPIFDVSQLSSLYRKK